MTIDERHLLLAFLGTNSGFLAKLTETLGRSQLAKVTTAAQDLKPQRAAPRGTDVSILDKGRGLR
jgi:hypothetical protein